MNSVVPPAEHATLDIGLPSTPSPRLTKHGMIKVSVSICTELRLGWFSATIQERTHWWEKVLEPTIIHDRMMVDELWGGERWYRVGGEKQWPRERITEAQLNYLLNEFEYLAGRQDKRILRTAVPMVYESSVLIPPSLKQSVRELAKRFEDLIHADPLELLDLERYLRDRPLDVAAPCNHHDWLARDVYGHTALDLAVSRSYQWLPTDFMASEEGRVTPKGYINNPNPARHRAGYAAIASVLQCFVPLLERVLSDELSPRPRLPFVIDPYKWYDHLIEPENLLDEDFEESPEGVAWMRAHHWPRFPDVLPFQPPSFDERVSLSLRGKTIRVIVKMAHIVLAPEKPAYPGGSWHIEGMQNERIVATGLFYYDSANMTESRLAFREAVGNGKYLGAPALEYELDDDSGYTLVYGIVRGTPLSQRREDVVATEDKCLAFPNMYQHCVAPFELADHSRPGYRKILALFLVDPFTAIHFTSQVPSQQERWYRDAVSGEKSLFRRLPQEILDVIMDMAKADREELMKERAKFVVTHNEQVFEAGFSMCEH
ncbi:hypothetical protein C8Q78DRAFT_1066532 [Trametes maxima]|nr:hypothetical protein C8Q78DRAFT_1066532 [Trametes maxima]